MTVGIIGLGLIGGSLAKAFRRTTGITVLGWDTDSSIVEFAEIAQAIHGPLTDDRLKELDLLLLATYPRPCWSTWSVWPRCWARTPWSSTAPAPRRRSAPGSFPWQSNTASSSWEVTPWRAPTTPASNTAGPTF